MDTADSGIVVIPDEGWIALYEHVPHWYAKLLGPIPPDGDERVVAHLDYMVFPDRESCEANVWENTEMMCLAAGWEFDPDQWELVQLVAINAN